MNSTISQTKDLTSSETSPNMASQESVVLPSEEDELNETNMCFD